MSEAARLGFDELRERNHVCWAELWRARPILHGADSRWQALADAAFFYLNTSAHQSSVSSTHIFGLSRWHDYHYYYGHVMWDIEAFAVPVLLLTQPHAARSILDFRARTADAAHSNAQLNGYRGLQFPWEAAPGEERRRRLEPETEPRSSTTSRPTSRSRSPSTSRSRATRSSTASTPGRC